MRSWAAELFSGAEDRKLLKLNKVLAQKDVCDSAGNAGQHSCTESRCGTLLCVQVTASNTQLRTELKPRIIIKRYIYALTEIFSQ